MVGMDYALVKDGILGYFEPPQNREGFKGILVPVLLNCEGI